MPLVRHPRRFKKVCFWEKLNRESLQELIAWKQGRLEDIEIENDYNNLLKQIDNSQGLAHYIKLAKTKFKTIFHCFFKTLKRILI